MKIEQGPPPMEGRYVVYCRCESAQVRDWVEPIIATYTPGKWHVPGNRGVLGWSGPIPPMKADAFFVAPKEYDL